MRLAVFSLWTGTQDFRLTRATAMLFSAAVAYGKKNFPYTELVTDINGLELSDRLGWDCTSYSTALEKFCPKGAEHVWMLGKIQAQAIQTEPHVHIDLDMLMFKPMPKRLTRAPVIAQSKDHPKSYYDPYVRSVIDFCGLTSHVAPVNTGLIGWNDLSFCQGYCEEALRLSALAGAKFDHGGVVSIICEQLLLAHMARERHVKVEVAIPLPLHVAPPDMQDVQFAHFWGESKSDGPFIDAVEKKFLAEFPEAYRRFLTGWSLLQNHPSVSSALHIYSPPVSGSSYYPGYYPNYSSGSVSGCTSGGPRPIHVL